MFRACFATILSITFLFSWSVVPCWAQNSPQPIPINLPKLETPLEIASVLVQPLGGIKEPLSGLIKKKAALGTVLLHLWAPNCAPCLPEIKALEQIRPKLEKHGIIVLTIAEDPDGMLTVPAFVRRYSLNGKDLYVDNTRALLHQLGGKGIPSTYQLSPDGKITAGQAGTVDWVALFPAH